jgi:glyceraldehyde 3-phosphate dehydrogenase
MSTETSSKASPKTYEAELKEWIHQEKAAIELIKLVGDLWFDKSVELVIFRNKLFDTNASEILNLHQYARDIVKKPINITDSVALAKAISTLELSPSRIDLGKLTSEWYEEKAKFADVNEFAKVKLANYLAKNGSHINPKDVVLFGFGRIGRLAARELISQAGKGEQLRLRAIVFRSLSSSDITKRADLLRHDSVHGPFPGTIIEDIENKALIINGHIVQLIAANSPEDIDYTAYGINNCLVIDNTGAFRDRVELSRHLTSKGVDQVLLTAPAGGDVPNIVHGVNQNTLDLENEKIFSAASCTTNAIVPVLKVLQDNFGVEGGHIETIHSYTNDQNLLDNYHKKYRRGRSAPLNMVITETGADKAVSKVLPVLAGKLTGNAVRVPTPNVSLAILNIGLNRTVTRDEVNNALKDAALNGDLVEQIQYSFNNELVSSDLVGNSCASIVDSPATIVSKNSKGVVIYAWYDNEYGYTRQVIRLAKHITKVRRLTYY